jgi:hypothetical protein
VRKIGIKDPSAPKPCVASHVDLFALLPGRWAAEMESRWIEVPLAISEWIGDDLDLKWSMPMNSPEQSRRGRNAGLDDPPQILRDPPDPRCSPAFNYP